ncbi:MAG: hypothetical protein K0R53_2333, partial [Burkholderiales bacterium]|nr:hypothetical protein [Burkholderiales bacterium]
MNLGQNERPEVISSGDSNIGWGEMSG